MISSAIQVSNMKIENKYQKEVPNSENVIAQKSYGSDTL